MTRQSNKTVAISGITGFIGAQITKDLLESGYTVHGTVRKNTPERVAHLAGFGPGKLVIFEADLLREGSFDAALTGCDYALHVASPYAMSLEDPQRQLVDPAVNGTLNFLASAKAAGVKTVVVTSSVGAITGRGKHDKVFTEDDWNTTSSLKSLPYFFSKVCSERAAWAYSKENDIKVVVINPGLVLGPSLVQGINESALLLQKTVQEGMGGIIDVSLAVVDVRDVSKAHIALMESETAEGRYLCLPSEKVVTHREITSVLLDMGYKVRTLDLTNPIVSSMLRLVSPVFPGGAESHFIRNSLGLPSVYNSDKLQREIGMTYRDQLETVRETVEDLIRMGHIAKP